MCAVNVATFECSRPQKSAIEKAESDRHVCDIRRLGLPYYIQLLS